MFLALAFAGTQIAVNDPGNASLSSDGDPKPDVGKLLYIAFAFGVSLAINAAIFADVSGAKFNPAVSLDVLSQLSKERLVVQHRRPDLIISPQYCTTLGANETRH